MPYINVDDVYIMDNTGKQVDDAVDYALANSNRNLLDNPWFTVNQRGVANGVNVNGNNFIADRWQAIGTTGATRNSDGSITITDTIFHKIPTDRELDWKTVTLSVLYADGTVDKNTFIWGGTSTRYFTYGRATVYGAAYQINFNNFTKNVRAVKLELGSYSTLANDVPPDYGEELRKCQRYFVRLVQAAPTIIGSGFCTSGGGGFVALIPTPVPMRAVTEVVGQGQFSLAHGSTRTNFTTVSVSHTQQNGVVVSGSGSVTANAPCTLFCNNTGYVDIKADL